MPMGARAGHGASIGTSTATSPIHIAERLIGGIPFPHSLGFLKNDRQPYRRRS
jgi:hypothetical protein